MRALAATVGAHSSTRRRQSSVLAVLICTALAFLTPNVALTGHEAPDDSSVFAYIGWLMHRGYVPYRDVWDHKGPLLYELNYLGWLISPDSTIGIGLLQAAIYLVCFYLLWRILDGLGVPQVPIYISLFFAMTCLAQVGQGSNMAETWAIAAIAISHWVAYRALSGGVRAHHAVLLGLSFAACFWIRPNLCVVPGFAILFAREASRRQRGPINGLFFLVSTGIAAAVTSAFVLAPVWLSSASNQFRAQYFAYNSAYTRAISWQGHWFGFLDLLAVPKSMALFYGGALGWLALLFRVRHMALPDSYRAFLLLTLPFEILAAGLSGRAYFHYLAPLAPSLCLLCGIAISCAQRRIESSPVVAQAVSILLLCAFAGLEVRRFLFFRLLYLRTDPTAVAVAAFIDRTTSSHDYIQPIGDGAADAIALRSRRHPASEFIYQLPMVHRVNAQRESQLHRFLTTLSQKEPSVIFSVPSAIGSLCASDFIGYRNIAARDGYEYGQLRRALEPELKDRYTLIRDPAFGPDCVYLRNDIAQSMLGRPKSSP